MVGKITEAPPNSTRLAKDFVSDFTEQMGVNVRANPLLTPLHPHWPPTNTSQPAPLSP